MNNKKGILIGLVVFLIVAIVAIILVFVKKAPNMEGGLANNNNENAENFNVIDTENMTVAEIEAMPVTEENIFVIKDDGSFSPKKMTAKYGQRLFITLSAEGEGDHIIQSEDPVMGQLLLIPVKGGEEAKSVAFPVPEPGEYSFYVDDKANTGMITVVK